LELEAIRCKNISEISEAPSYPDKGLESTAIKQTKPKEQAANRLLCFDAPTHTPVDNNTASPIE
jgi:hypothetical protein